MIDCVAPGGICVVTVNGAAWKQLNLEPEIRRAAERHGFVIEAIETIDYIRAQNIDARVLIIRR